MLLRGLGRRHASTLKRYALSAAATDGGPGCAARTSTGHTCRTDLPRAAGGKDGAPQPVELVLAALVGCKTATAHYVARHLFPRPHNKIESIVWEDVVGKRDEKGPLALPIEQPPPVFPGLASVTGVALVRLRPGSPVSAADVAQLGQLVEQRCPVAVMFVAAGCDMDMEWRLDVGESDGAGR